MEPRRAVGNRNREPDPAERMRGLGRELGAAGVGSWFWFGQCGKYKLVAAGPNREPGPEPDSDRSSSWFAGLNQYPRIAVPTSGLP